MIFIFWLLVFLICYTMMGYPILLKLLSKIFIEKKIDASFEFQPNVSVIVPAHNEEHVIEHKIINLLKTDYPLDKLEIIIASDNSTDGTNHIVEEYVINFPNLIKLLKVEVRKGKTNAQDEAVNFSKGEVLVLTDANSMFHPDAIIELTSTLNDQRIAYVAGKLDYINTNSTETSMSESTYWNIDLEMRKIESDLSSITAGNGSIYAVRKSEYVQINPIYSHDSVFPPKFVIKGKRAVFNPKAIATEKAGESDEDELKRKIRMARKNISLAFYDFEKYNFFKHGLFSLFYFSHRTLRNSLYLFHFLLFIVNLYLLITTNNIIVIISFYFHVIVFSSVFEYIRDKSKYFRLVYYYLMTIYAQFIGAKNELLGKSKPFWEKAESTR